MVTQLAISNVTAINNLGTTPQFVIFANPSRNSLTFHNPGTNSVVVFPASVLVNGANVPLAPTISALGGGFLLPSGAALFMGGTAAKQQWQALALTGGGNPLTITED
jgi:hypothetical protein